MCNCVRLCVGGAGGRFTTIFALIILSRRLDSELEQIPDIITRQKEEEEDEVACVEESEDAGRVQATPDRQMDDLALRRAQTKPRPLHREGPISLTSTTMSQADVQKWERLRMSEPRCTPQPHIQEIINVFVCACVFVSSSCPPK